MKITVILGPFYPAPAALGGAVEKIQLQLAQAYAAAGHDVTMISRQFDTFPVDEVVAGVHHIRIPSFNRVGTLAANLAFDVIYSLRAAQVMPFSDITVTNGFSLPLLIPRKRTGCLYVNVNRFPKGQFFLYRRVDRFQAVSSIVADAIVKQMPAYKDKISVIGNPVSQQYFVNGSKTKSVLFVGRIAREKGIHCLIQAFAAVNAADWELRIVGPHFFEHGGDGDNYLGELKQLSAALGIRCQFVGPIFNEKALIDEYARAAIFVYPTLAARGEALPVAPLEAMAACCAVVTSKLRCFDDYIRDRETALQFDHRGQQPSAELAGLLRRLVSDPIGRERLAHDGRTKAEEFRLPVIANKMLGDFEYLLRH